MKRHSQSIVRLRECLDFYILQCVNMYLTSIEQLSRKTVLIIKVCHPIRNVIDTANENRISITV